MKTTIDPVCGMKVKPEQATGDSMYKGKLYYFCGSGCKDKFEATPTNFIKPPPHRDKSNTCH